MVSPAPAILVFRGKPAAQTLRAITGICLVFAVLPGTFALRSGLAIFFHRLDGATVKTIEHDLAARNGAAPLAS